MFDPSNHPGAPRVGQIVFYYQLDMSDDPPDCVGIISYPAIITTQVIKNPVIGEGDPEPGVLLTVFFWDESRPGVFAKYSETPEPDCWGRTEK